MHQESASAISPSTKSSSSSSIWAIMNTWFTPTVLFVLLNLIIGIIAYTSSLTHPKNLRNKPKITDSPSLLQRLKSIYSPHQSQEKSLNQDIDTDQSVQTRNLDETAFAHESHYLFQENLQSQVHPIFSGTHELTYQETPAHFVPDQKDNTFGDFQLPHEQILLEGGDQNISCDSIKTDLAFNDKDSIFDDFQQTHEEKVPEDNVNEVSCSNNVKDSNFTRTLSDIASLKSGLGHLEAEEIHEVEARRPKTVRERGSSKATEGDDEVDSKADDFINRFKHQLKLQRLDSIVRYRDVLARGRAVP